MDKTLNFTGRIVKSGLKGIGKAPIQGKTYVNSQLCPHCKTTNKIEDAICKKCGESMVVGGRDVN